MERNWTLVLCVGPRRRLWSCRHPYSGQRFKLGHYPFCLTRFHGSVVRSGERIQQLVQVDDSDAGGHVTHGVGKYEVSGMDHSAAGVNDIGDITKSLPPGGNEYGLAGLADDL